MLNEPKEGFRPIRGNVHHWTVHTPASAVEVLSENGYEKTPNFRTCIEEQGRPYLVNAAAPEGLKVGPDEPLWQVLTHIAKTHLVEVLVPGKRDFVSWTGTSHDPDRIITIRISARANAQAA